MDLLGIFEPYLGHVSTSSSHMPSSRILFRKTRRVHISVHLGCIKHLLGFDASLLELRLGSVELVRHRSNPSRPYQAQVGRPLEFDISIRSLSTMRTSHGFVKTHFGSFKPDLELLQTSTPFSLSLPTKPPRHNAFQAATPQHPPRCHAATSATPPRRSTTDRAHRLITHSHSLCLSFLTQSLSDLSRSRKCTDLAVNVQILQIRKCQDLPVNIKI
uniref:Uncharacterized protein n=1 Tax=Fagus sylvatica TaxID=28930 RepID=A0A2N9F8W3_FAGSY